MVRSEGKIYLKTPSSLLPLLHRLSFTPLFLHYFLPQGTSGNAWIWSFCKFASDDTFSSCFALCFVGSPWAARESPPVSGAPPRLLSDLAHIAASRCFSSLSLQCVFPFFPVLSLRRRHLSSWPSPALWWYRQSAALASPHRGAPWPPDNFFYCTIWYL